MDKDQGVAVDYVAALLKIADKTVSEMAPGSLNYGQAEYLFDLADKLSERLEELRATAPDNPDAEEDEEDGEDGLV